MNHCPYCGHRCYGRTCQYHADLRKIEAAMPAGWYVEELREAVREAARRGEVFEGDYTHDVFTGELVFGEDETAALVREAKGTEG